MSGQSQSQCSSVNNSFNQEGNRIQRHGREIVEFSVKGPIGLSLNDELTNSGCALLDLIFTVPSEVGELTFRNYYTMWITILVKVKIIPDEVTGTNIGSLPISSQHSKEEISEWMTSIPKKMLMKYPHHENGSHDLISISCTESCVEWKNLVAMRIVLRQPSPVWKTFHIEEINVYKDLPRRMTNKDHNVESLAVLMKRQTMAALKWTPSTENVMLGVGGAYEFNSLPQP